MKAISKIKERIKNVFFFYKRKQEIDSNGNIFIVKGINNEIKNSGVHKNVTYDIVGDNNTVSIGEEAILCNALVYIRGHNHKIELHHKCRFNSGDLWIEDNNGAIILHANTTIEHAHLAVTEPGCSIIIENDCMISKNVEIRTGDSHSIIDLETGSRINYAASVKLESHVWVGAHAKILKGVTIGHNSVIGTNAVVTKPIPPNSLASGIPAKVLRSGIDWKRERIFQK